MKKNYLLLIVSLSLVASICSAQDTSGIVKFRGVKTWEIKESPQNIGYEIEPNWLKLTKETTPLIVTGAAVDSKDRIYILDRDSLPAVTCVNLNGELLFQWKLKGFGSPHFIYIDKNDDMWITDIGTHQIYKMSKTGEIIFSLGVKNEKGSDNKHFDKPTDIDFLKDGSVLISDGYGINKRVIKLDSNFNYIEEWGSKGTEPGKFVVPHALTVGSDGRVYVADRDAYRIQIFDDKGKLVEVWPHIGRVFDMVESFDHFFYCIDGATGRITKVNDKGEVIGFFGEGDQLLRGHGMAITSNGTIIAALKNGRIEKFVKK